MDKTTEIDLLTKFAVKLGTNSYFGPILTEALPSIIADIRNDVEPESPTSVLARLRKEIEFSTEQVADLSTKRSELSREVDRLRAVIRRAGYEMERLQRGASDITSAATRLEATLREGRDRVSDALRAVA